MLFTFIHATRSKKFHLMEQLVDGVKSQQFLMFCPYNNFPNRGLSTLIYVDVTFQPVNDDENNISQLQVSAFKINNLSKSLLAVACARARSLKGYAINRRSQSKSSNFQSHEAKTFDYKFGWTLLMVRAGRNTYSGNAYFQLAWLTFQKYETKFKHK